MSQLLCGIDFFHSLSVFLVTKRARRWVPPLPPLRECLIRLKRERERESVSDTACQSVLELDLSIVLYIYTVKLEKTNIMYGKNRTQTFKELQTLKRQINKINYKISVWIYILCLYIWYLFIHGQHSFNKLIKNLVINEICKKITF